MPLIIVNTDITRINTDAYVSFDHINSVFKKKSRNAFIAADRESSNKTDTSHTSLSNKDLINEPASIPPKTSINISVPQSITSKNYETSLSLCYSTALSESVKRRCESLSVPLFTNSEKSHENEKQLNIAVDTIRAFLEKYDMTVYLVVPEKKYFQINKHLLSEITEYINERLIITDQAHLPRANGYMRHKSLKKDNTEVVFLTDSMPAMPLAQSESAMFSGSAYNNSSLVESLNHLDESFSEMLLRKIDSSGMTDSECYKKANIDRKLFSKIRSDRLYRPSKPTVIAFAIALELTLEETNEMLMKAGFALSHSNKFDIIIEYFLKNKTYDIFIINETLFKFDQPLLGM